MDKKELVKTIREKAGEINWGIDELIASLLPNCIACGIDDIVKLSDIPESMWIKLYDLIVRVVDNEITRK